ncbi:palmitoyltransferase ZDHHC1-like [Ornithodoros turicata]|uniref:palmitoyltransferase ZDHHC1-like n=1 Tax=Ornithodoros turicata TaxID=34597 RepID=UPI003138D636
MTSEVAALPWYCNLWILCQTLVECGSKTPRGNLWSRKNGWSLPLNPLQLLAWFFLTYFLVFYFAVLVPHCPPGAWQITLYVLNTILATVHIASHICSTSIDPADRNVLNKNIKGPLPVFDRSKHAHVIENQFCYICEVKVGCKAKHCSSCNKCVATFDHHCKWLNNCVGGKNYRYFAVCIATALAASLLIFCVSVALIVAYLVKDSWLHLSVLENNSTVAYPGNVPLKDPMFAVIVPVDAVVWLAAVVVCAVLSFFAIGLLSHLSGFHLFLAFRGLSTYDYIVQKRDSSYHMAATDKTKDLFLHWCKSKANQISPAQPENQSTKCRKDSTVGRNNKATGRDVFRDGTQMDEKSASLCAGDVYVGSPTRQHIILREIQRSHLKASQEGLGTKPTQVLDCGNRSPTVQIAQPGSECSHSQSEHVGL